MSHQFHIGQRVTPKAGAPLGKFKGYSYPKMGQVLTIRDMFCHPSVEGVVLLFHEVRNSVEPPAATGREPGFGAKWFHPTQMGPISSREHEANQWRQEKSELLAENARLRGELAAERAANQNMVQKLALFRGDAPCHPKADLSIKETMT